MFASDWDEGGAKWRAKWRVEGACPFCGGGSVGFERGGNYGVRCEVCRMELSGVLSSVVAEAYWGTISVDSGKVKESALKRHKGYFESMVVEIDKKTEGGF